jgi:hypothetical protein
LRNPDDKAKELTLDVGKAFELPVGAKKDFKLTSPYADQRIQKVDVTAGTPHVFSLEPFEVLVFESHPLNFGRLQAAQAGEDWKIWEDLGSERQ